MSGNYTHHACDYTSTCRFIIYIKLWSYLLHHSLFKKTIVRKWPYIINIGKNEFAGKTRFSTCSAHKAEPKTV
jgi:hypothetical protein